jgi:hypothetical protein
MIFSVVVNIQFQYLDYPNIQIISGATGRDAMAKGRGGRECWPQWEGGADQRRSQEAHSVLGRKLEQFGEESTWTYIV